MHLVEYADREMMELQVADTLAAALKNCLLMHDLASFAVPGGTTPGPIFDILSGTHLDWNRVQVLLTDERWVPEEDPRSNTKLVKERLLTDHAAAASFLPFYRDGMEVDAGCRAASEAFTDTFPISLLVLGMGGDMHTASLFPGAEGLAQALASDAPPLCPIRDPGQEIARATLSAPYLRGAMETHVLITGEEKRAALEKARSLPPEEAPISLVLGDATVHWAA